MPFPEFDPDKKKLLFFSRGRGRGHAIPDMEIVRELQALRDDIDVRFVSYGTGARTIEEFGFPLIDLGLPDDNSIVDTTILAGKLIGWLDPDLVVAHEEFSAMPAAKIFDKKTVFIIDWFVEPGKYSMQTLRHADEILFIDEPGIFEEPEYLKGKIKYVGPVLRKFEYTRKDRDRARTELGIPLDATVIGVFPGSWTEQKAPIFDLVMGAFELLEAEPKRLIWAAGDDHDQLQAKRCSHTELLAFPWHDPIDQLMAATDLAISKGSRKTLVELSALEIPTIFLSSGQNYLDETRHRARLGTQLSTAQTNPETLSGRIATMLARPSSGGAMFPVALNSAASVAATFLDLNFAH